MRATGPPTRAPSRSLHAADRAVRQAAEQRIERALHIARVARLEREHHAERLVLDLEIGTEVELGKLREQLVQMLRDLALHARHVDALEHERNAAEALARRLELLAQ